MCLEGRFLGLVGPQKFRRISPSNGDLQLVGGLEHFIFSHMYGIIIQIDELIFFGGLGQPPTSQWFLPWEDLGNADVFDDIRFHGSVSKPGISLAGLRRSRKQVGISALVVLMPK